MVAVYYYKKKVVCVYCIDFMYYISKDKKIFLLLFLFSQQRILWIEILVDKVYLDSLVVRINK